MIQNARDPEQVIRMKKLLESGACFFCFGGKEFQVVPEVKKDFSNFYISTNRYPITGSVHHYLIVPKRHIEKTTDLNTEERIEIFDIIEYLEKELSVDGYSIFARSGNPMITGGTLKHLHFHFVVGGQKPQSGETWPDKVLPVILGYKK